MTLTLSYVLIGLISLLTFLYYYLTWNYNHWQKQGVPVINGALPGLGNTWKYLFQKRDFATLLESFYAQSRGHSMAGYYNTRQPVLLVRHPDLVKTVLETNFASFNDNMLKVNPKLDPLLVMNPIFSDTVHWKALRSQLAASFTSGKLKCMFAGVQNVCTKLSWYFQEKVNKSNGQVVELELKELFSKYTAEVMANVIFEMEDDSLKNEKVAGPFLKVGQRMFKTSTWINRFKKPLIYFLPILSTLFGISRVPSNVDQFFRKTMDDSLKRRSKIRVFKNDFLQLMLELRTSGKIYDSLGTRPNGENVISYAMSFFLDGYETSSVAISSVCYQLAKYPEIQEKVRQEVNSVLSEHDNLSYEALLDMTYMDQVFNETMRMYPAFGPLLKVCSKEFYLEGPDGLSCRIEPGTGVAISINGLHMDPDYWPDPEKFDPERFNEENKRERHRFLFLPFGNGPRICIGMRMAIMQMKAAIASIVESYSLEVSPRTQVPFQFDTASFISVVKDGLWVYVKSI